MSAHIASSIFCFNWEGKSVQMNSAGGYLRDILSVGQAWDERMILLHIQVSWSNPKKRKDDESIFYWFEAQVPLLEWSGYGRFQTAAGERAQFEGRMPSVQKTLNMGIVRMKKYDFLSLLAQAYQIWQGNVCAVGRTTIQI